jgi:LMBR1 domain-containing protein 1
MDARYEEWDVDTTTSARIKGAVKYSFGFFTLMIILLLVGLFIPITQDTNGHFDLDYFKKLLAENSMLSDNLNSLKSLLTTGAHIDGERALTFITGTLLCLAIIPYVFYTAPGLALTPLLLIASTSKTAPPSSSPSTHQDLLLNRERQRIIEARYVGASSRFTAKDRRELEGLQREERTLVRRQRIAQEGTRKWMGKLQAVGRPLRILFGVLILLVALVIFLSMFLTSIDKSQNSICGQHCGYILAKMKLFNPLNWMFVKASRAFPADYILALILVLDLFVASVVGIAFVGIRFLWVSLFRIRPGHTKPQGMLMATVMLMLTVLAINYSVTMIIAPQYAHYGGQRFCDKTVILPLQI